MREDLAAAEKDGDRQNFRLLCTVIFFSFGGGVFNLVGYALFSALNVWIFFGVGMGGLVLLSIVLVVCYASMDPILFKTFILAVSVLSWIGFMTPLLVVVSAHSNKIPN